jgi:hypothetical protein
MCVSAEPESHHEPLHISGQLLKTGALLVMRRRAATPQALPGGSQASQSVAL